MKRWIATISAWAVAVVTAYVLATLAATQSVISRLDGMGISVSFAERVSMSAKDLLGMSGLYLPLIAVALLLAWPVAGWLGRRSPEKRTLLFVLAGATAILCIHLALNWSFDITLVAVARTPLGLLSQVLAGAAAGYLYTRLKQARAD